uniref:PABS domain-containing protein n=2 Tax=Clastoptera arizonana TaxID=38151 RepID=A0A1B6DKE3_9HEMI
MAVHTNLLDFSIEPTKIDVGERENLIEIIHKVLSSFLPNLKLSHTTSFNGGGFVTLLTGTRDSFVTIRGFPKGLISINIEYFKEDSDDQLLKFESLKNLETALSKKIGSIRSHKLPAIRRDGKFDRFYVSSDERILEYDIDAVLLEEMSPYQKIQIVHSKSLGNMLVLDGLQNLSEKDLIYTETLMQRGKENYENKEIIILGGGDGALLYELLKEQPKFVHMFELDDMVLKACREHMRVCCGDCLDNLEGEKYKIIVDDCVKSLDTFIKEGKKVDYVFGDLTDIPVSNSPHGEVWDFIRLILNKSMQVLKPTGKFMTHGNGAASPGPLRMFEEQLNNLIIPVEFKTETAFVPSFLEEWVFYQIKPSFKN